MGRVSNRAGRRLSRLRRYRWIALPGGLLLILIVVDSLVGAFFYRTSVEAHVFVTPAAQGQAKRVIVILPGFAMSGRLVAEAFAPIVSTTDALIAVDYAERGVDTADIYRQVMSALDSLQPTQWALYGASMGGMVGADLLRRYQQDGAPFGKVDLVLDTAPAAFADVKRPEWLLKVARWYRGGPIATAVYAMTLKSMDSAPPGAGSDPVVVAEAHAAGAWAGTAAIATQGNFIGRFSQARHHAELDQVTSRAFYLHGMPSDVDDPLIAVEPAMTRWRQIFPALIEVPVAGRDAKWHIPLVERPGETVAAILSVLDRK